LGRSFFFANEKINKIIAQTYLAYNYGILFIMMKCGEKKYIVKKNGFELVFVKKGIFICGS
jgi:hypothetical protein